MFNSGIEFTGLLLVLFLQLNGEALLFTVEISFQIRQILDVQQSLSACCWQSVALQAVYMLVLLQFWSADVLVTGKASGVNALPEHSPFQYITAEAESANSVIFM